MTSLWVIRFLFGAGEAGCFPNLTRMLSQWLPRGERIRAQALMWACTRWGGAITPPLALLGINLFGWRWSFVAFALLGVVWCVAFLIWFRENPADHPKVNAAELELLKDSHALVTEEQEGHGWVNALLKPQTLMLMVQYFCWSYIWYFFVTWLPTYLREAHGLSAAETAGLSVLPLFCGGLGSLASGMIPLRVPRRLIAVLSFSTVAILLLIIPHVSSVFAVITIMAAISFSGDLTVPVSWNACVEVGTRNTATVAASMNMFGNFAGFAAPFVAGILLKKTDNDWNSVFYVMAGFAILGALLWLVLDPSGEKAERRARLIDAEGLQP
jgi:MFS family permease